MTAEPDRPEREEAFRDRVEELVFECLERPADEREGALEELCRRQPELADQLRARFQKLRSIGLDEERTAPAEESPPLDRFGDYRILERLGGGGMGVVYLAEHEELGRKVALKLIRSEHLHFPRARERFRREVQAASRLDDPCICTVYEAGEIEGVPYLAMRYLDGETLADRIARARSAESSDSGALTAGLATPPGREVGGTGPSTATGTRGGVPATVWLFERLARALHTAHEAGLVHRDVKPGNVMVTTHGDPVLLDFGLAHDESAEGQQLTISGELLGTPAYMAPEQVSRKGGRIDRRTDVYGLGATFYECLTLRSPFTAESREELYRHILTTDPPSPRRLNPQVSHDLRAVVEKALEKDPRRRYRTALELAEDLSRIRTFEPVRARAVGPLARLHRWARRHPAAAAIIALLVVGLVVTTVLFARTDAALKHARALALAGAVAEVLDDDPKLALHLALRGVEAEDVPETISEVHRAFGALHEVRVFDQGTWPEDMKLWPDGRFVLTGGQDATGRIWDLEGESEPVLLSHLAENPHFTAAVAVSPDAQLVATAVRASVKLWRPDGTFVRELDHGELGAAWVQTVEFCPEPGKQLVLTGTYESLDPLLGVARLWHVDGTLLTEIPAHQGPCWARFFPDGERILTFAGTWSPRRVFPDRTARLWTLDGAPIGEPMRHLSQISCAAISPSGDPRILTTCFDSESRLWDGDGRPVCELRGLRGITFHGAFSPDGELLVTCSNDCTARIYRAKDGALLRELRGHTDEVQAAAFSPPGAAVPLIVTGGRDQAPRVWTYGGQNVAVFCGHRARGYLWDLAFLPGRTPPRIVTASQDGTVRVWDLWNPELPVLIGHEAPILCADITPDGELVATGDAEGVVRLWDRATGRSLRAWRDHSGSVFWVCFSPDGSKLATVCQVPGTVKIWNRTGTELLFPPIEHGGITTVVRFLPDGQTLLVATGDGPRLFGFDGREVETGSGGLWSPVNPPFWLCLAPGDDRILARNTRGHLRLWDRAGRTATDIAEEVRTAAFHPDGERVLFGGRDGAIRVWEPGGRRPREFCSTGVGVQTIDVSGEFAVTAHADGVARLWTLEGELVATLRGHRRGLRAAMFTPDGSRVLTISNDATGRFWFTRTEELLERARLRDDRVLTRVEQRRYQGLLPAAETH